LTSLPKTDPAAASLRRVRIAVGFAGLLLIAATLLGATSDVLLALPVVFLVAALVAGRYPGLKTLVRLATRLRGRRVRPLRASPPASDARTLEPRALRLLFGTRILRGPPSVAPAAA
jgi:hypothetical protein